MGLIPDPGFDDPAAWSFDGTGASITDSQLRFVDPIVTDSATVPASVAVIGQEYQYRIVVSRYATAPLTAWIKFGGVLIYDAGGAGVFTGRFTATSTAGLSILAMLAGEWFLDSIQVVEMHARQIIRESVAVKLTGLATTGARVYQSRVYNVQESELPCLLVYTVSEEVEEVTLGDPRTLTRTVTLVVEGKAQAAANLDDTLDDIGEEVETAIGSDPDLSIDAYDTIISTIEIDYSADGDVPVGSIVMRFLVTYRAAENAPGVML